MTIKYVATINVPGYLPMADEPPVFDDAASAWGYLADERERGEDDTYGAPGDSGEPGYSETVAHLREQEEQCKTGNLIALGGDPCGTVYGGTPGYDGDHDLGLAYSVSVASPEDIAAFDAATGESDDTADAPQVAPDVPLTINAPMIITSRLMPGIRIGTAYVSLTPHGTTRDGRMGWRYVIDIPGLPEYDRHDVSGAVGDFRVGSDAHRAMLATVLSFLATDGEKYGSTMGSEPPADGWLFTPAIAEWAYGHDGDLFAASEELRPEVTGG